VLWFTKSKFDDQELKWESPWGIGYPGWHIECSAICIKNLGERLDIHCGGVDNIFPHHTNEIAQSEAYLGHKWCNYWFHIHHLNTANGKMSKSKGEFLTVSLLREKGYDPLVYRFFCLQSHYRKGLAFSYEALDNAKIAYEKLVSRIASLNADGAADENKVKELVASFETALDNDLNTSLAITAVYDVLKSDASDADKLAAIADMDTVLSLGLIEAAKKVNEKAEAPAAEGELAAWIEEMIEKRAAAKKEKNYAEADRIRAELSDKGITLIDTKEGTKYEIK
ncbi:MAG: cysteine--tRNA ligase, partial [Clostridia bacterium]|nr:cysteine--tRNA ligase [Clostridia bacterium]